MGQFSSVTQSCPALWEPMDCSTPGLPVHYQLAEFTHTYIHQVGDAIQPSRPLSSPSPPALNLPWGQGLNGKGFYLLSTSFVVGLDWTSILFTLRVNRDS